MAISASYYEIDDKKARKKAAVMTPCAWRIYDNWCSLVINNAMDPHHAARQVSDANSEKLSGDQCSFRLNKRDRVKYSKVGNKITVHSIGGHD